MAKKDSKKHDKSQAQESSKDASKEATPESTQDATIENTQEPATEAPADQAHRPVFALQRTYIKDASLEMPNAPEIFLNPNQPKVDISIDIDRKELPDNFYESSLTATITTKIDDKTLYLVEVTQAGIFEIRDLPVEQLDPLLGIVCPSMLFPYLRAHVSDLITRTSLPTLHLADINFQALYEQRLQEEAAQETKQ
ncbi:protein-export chaperone SecB [Brackiella oedipodis]|uniref:protein-export chaperone SecB n=1 Tax=Brackiella oedipodis TaxID=124225 RepID=UPI000A04D5E0|nr:protein-export chaperone SecB [Brackiella oedipodis]